MYTRRSKIFSVAATAAAAVATLLSSPMSSSSSSPPNSMFAVAFTTSTSRPQHHHAFILNQNNNNCNLHDNAYECHDNSYSNTNSYSNSHSNNNRMRSRVVLSSNTANTQEAITQPPPSSSSSAIGEIIMNEDNNTNNNNSSNNMQSITTSISHTIPKDTFTLPPSAAPTRDGRLLCASQCAYAIKPPYFKSSAYRPATTAKRLTKGVNSVVIGHTIDGICIAFRGTQSSSPLDWLQNAALFLSNVEDGRKKPIKGKVHTGFYRGTKSLWKPLRGIIKEMLEESKVNGWKQDVILTGHSKGGAMATVAAVLMKRDSDLPDPSYVCTFASAKVGDSEFCLEYNKNINQTSYEAHLDLVPFLPPSSATMEMMNETMTEMLDSMLWSDTSIQKKENYKWDYQTVGTRKFITENNEIIDDVTKELDEERIKEIEKYSFLSLDEFKASHCSSCASECCNGYYFNALAGSVCNEDECSMDDDEQH